MKNFILFNCFVIIYFLSCATLFGQKLATTYLKRISTNYIMEFWELPVILLREWIRFWPERFGRFLQLFPSKPLHRQRNTQLPILPQRLTKAGQQFGTTFKL
jgi:hypothetical protein